MLYTFLQPVQYVMNADTVNEAIKNSVKFHRFHNISPEDLNLFKIVDNEDEVLEALDTFYKKYNLSPNF